MSHLLHIDSSILVGEASITRRLTARAAARWLAAHPGGSVNHRDLGAEPLPHYTTRSAQPHRTPEEDRTPEQVAAFALTHELKAEIVEATTVILGLPLYNFGAPSAVKSWVDHLISPGVTFDLATHQGWLGGRELIVLAARGGGYAPGTELDGWDHSEAWLPHGLWLTGLEPRFITAEFTLAFTEPMMAGLLPQANESVAAAERAIDALWEPGAGAEPAPGAEA